MSRMSSNERSSERSNHFLALIRCGPIEFQVDFFYGPQASVSLSIRWFLWGLSMSWQIVVLIYLADIDLLTARADFNNVRGGGVAVQDVWYRASLIVTNSLTDTANIFGHVPVDSQQGVASIVDSRLICCFNNSRYKLRLPKWVVQALTLGFTKKNHRTAVNTISGCFAWFESHFAGGDCKWERWQNFWILRKGCFKYRWNWTSSRRTSFIV